MKTLRIISLAVAVLLTLGTLCGCSALDSVLNPTFDIPAYGLTLTAEFGFADVTDGTSFDLQITNTQSYISIYAYNYSDFTDGSTPESTYEYHNTDLFGKRENVRVVDEQKSEVLDGKTSVRTVYSAERDGVENYYVSYLIDYPAEEIFAWVLVTSTPEYIDGNLEDLEEIVYSLSIKEE